MEEEIIIQKIQEQFDFQGKLIEKKFEAQDKKMDDIFETINFLKDNSVTKDEFQQLSGEFHQLSGEFQQHVGEFQSFREETKEEFRKVRSEIIDHVDGFVGLHQHLEVELAAVTNKTNRLESQIGIIAKHLQLELQ